MSKHCTLPSLVWGRIPNASGVNWPFQLPKFFKQRFQNLLITEAFGKFRDNIIWENLKAPSTNPPNFPSQNRTKKKLSQKQARHNNQQIGYNEKQPSGLTKVTLSPPLSMILTFDAFQPTPIPFAPTPNNKTINPSKPDHPAQKLMGKNQITK